MLSGLLIKGKNHYCARPNGSGIFCMFFFFKLLAAPGTTCKTTGGVMGKLFKGREQALPSSYLLRSS